MNTNTVIVMRPCPGEDCLSHTISGSLCHWCDIKKRTIPDKDPRATAFYEALESLEVEHGVSLEHEDHQGAWILMKRETDGG